MIIHIFGDSFFDEEQKSGKTWIDMLRNLYTSEKIKNYSVSGTGPHYNLPLIVNMILNEKITSDDFIICHTSGTTRVNFPMKKGTTVDVYWDHVLKESHTSSTNPHFYNNFQNEINFAYLTFDKFLQISGHLMAGYLHSISNTKNIKVLLFGNTNNGNGKNEIQVLPFDDKNFHLSKFDLFEVSDNEIFFKEVDNWDYLYGLHDTRNNHLSLENHEIFFEYVLEFITTGAIKKDIKFKENFRHAEDVFTSYSKHKNFNEKFIYE